MKKGLLLILTAILTFGATAQTPFAERFNVVTLNMRSGLPNNHVDDLFTDSYGFMWIASLGGGLLKYDGYTFFSPTVYDMGFTPKSNSCRRIDEDKQHRLWVCYEEGTDIIDLQTMQKHQFSGKDNTQLDSILAQPSVHVHCDSQGNIWLATRTYIYYMSFDDDGSLLKTLRYQYNSSAPDVQLRDIEGNGTIWTAIDGGLYRIAPNGNQLVKQEIALAFRNLNSGFISDFLQDDNFIWVGTVDGLFRYGKHDHELKHYTHGAEARSLSHNATTSLTLTTDGTLLVGTLCGLNIYHPQTDDFEHWTASSPIPLGSDFVTCVVVRGRQIWVGTETGGITRLTPRHLQLHNYVHQPGNDSSLSPNAVNAMYATTDGTLWAGTVEGGLNCRLPSSDTFIHITKSNSQLPHNSVSVITADDKERLWIGTWGGGLCWLNIHQRLVNPIIIPPPYHLLTQYVGALAHDKTNNGLWIGANNGLFFYDFATNNIMEPFEGCLEVRGCIGSLITKEGELWIGCLDGLRIVDLKKRDAKGRFNVRILRNRLDAPESGIIEKICCFCQTNDGTIWLGSNEYGLYHRTTDKQGHEHFQRYTQQQGLANNAVKGIVEDNRGQLWITTNNGLSLMNPETGVFTNYGTEDGLACQQFYWNSAIKGPDGTIYLGSDRALTELNGENKIGEEQPWNLRFTHLTIDNVDITAASNYLNKDISQAKKIQLHESNKSFVLSFSALNFTGEHNGTYSYRMKGFDNRWTKLPPGEHSVHFTSLPPGNYTLEVRYESAYTGEGQQTISVDIDVMPYFWHSWWFIAIVLVMLSVLASWLYRRRMQWLSRKIKAEEEKRLMAPIEKAVLESENPEQMQARIQDILHIQKTLEESSEKTAEADNEKAKMGSRPFMQKVTETMEQNYMNSEFGVQEMCDIMGMSRSLLSKRLNEEAGQPATQFIRNYRLDIARRLLSKKDSPRNIAEIAFSVGFNDPKYFTRCFTKQFGVSPSNYSGQEEPKATHNEVEEKTAENGTDWPETS